MAVNKQRAALKTALLAPGTSLVTWGMQLLIDGQLYTGGAGVLVGVAFFAGFVLLEEYDIPYEDEIAEMIASQDNEAVTEAGEEVAEGVADAFEDRLRGRER